MVAPPDPTRRLRRRRRLLAVIPAGLLTWTGMVAIPGAPTSAKPGTMHTEILTLTGPTGSARGTSAGAGAGAGPDAAGPGWSTTVDVDAGTQAVAASWTGAPTGAVDVRGRTADGWTAWTTLEANPDEAPDDATRDAGGMAWWGSPGVDEVELKVVDGDLHDLQIQPMRYEAPSGGSGLVTAAAGASAAQPDIQPRSSWTSKGWVSGNSGCASGPVSASGGIKFAVIHHTVNSNTYAASDVPAMLASIYAYHTGTNGWCDIAYNFIVDRFGRIWEGRSGGITKPIVGGHAQGFNTGSMGVSFLGQFEPGASPTAAQPTDAAVDAAGRLIGWKLGLGGIDPTGTVTVTSGGSNRWPSGTVLTIPRIIGHRDVGYTACPGQNLYDRLSDIRAVAKDAQGGSPTTTTTAPTTTTTTPPPPSQYAPFDNASTLVTQQYRDLLRRNPSDSDLSFWNARAGTTWPPGQFVAQLATSSEADDRVDAVIRLYEAYFLRNPDHGGLTYWLNRRGEGRTLVSISNSFAVSSEFTRRYGSLTNAEFVDRVYQNVMGRPADAGGLAYWAARLDGGTSRGQVMANFSQSSEYVRKTDAGVHVVAVIEGMLQRAPEPDVYALFTAGLENGATSVTALATYVWDGAEYQARFS